MAAAKEKEDMIEVTAKVNIKYDTETRKAGEGLKIRQSDLKELQDKEYVSYTPTVQQQQSQQPDPTPPANK